MKPTPTALKGSFAAHSFDWVGDANTYKVTEKCTVCGQSREILDFVFVKGGTVTGATPSWLDGISVTNDYGVFVDDRTVKLSDFFIGKYEVTQAEWKEVMGENNNPSNFKVDNLPVEKVSWYDAVVYCNKRSIAEKLTPCYKKGTETDPSKWGEVSTSSNDEWNEITCDLDAGGYRLPTEAEWEYAARGGKQGEAAWNNTYAGTNDKLGEYAWYSGTTGVDNKTHEVGTKKANSLGIHDMSGNVSEWCWDWYDSDPKKGDTGGESPVTDPTGPASGSNRVNRGGGWNGDAGYCSVSRRINDSPGYRDYSLGFRVVRPSSK